MTTNAQTRAGLLLTVHRLQRMLEIKPNFTPQGREVVRTLEKEYLACYNFAVKKFKNPPTEHEQKRINKWFKLIKNYDTRIPSNSTMVSRVQKLWRKQPVQDDDSLVVAIYTAAIEEANDIPLLRDRLAGYVSVPELKHLLDRQPQLNHPDSQYFFKDKHFLPETPPLKDRLLEWINPPKYKWDSGLRANEAFILKNILLSFLHLTYGVQRAEFLKRQEEQGESEGAVMLAPSASPPLHTQPLVRAPQPSAPPPQPSAPPLPSAPPAVVSQPQVPAYRTAAAAQGSGGQQRRPPAPPTTEAPPPPYSERPPFTQTPLFMAVMDQYLDYYAPDLGVSNPYMRLNPLIQNEFASEVMPILLNAKQAYDSGKSDNVVQGFLPKPVLMESTAARNRARRGRFKGKQEFLDRIGELHRIEPDHQARDILEKITILIDSANQWAYCHLEYAVERMRLEIQRIGHYVEATPEENKVIEEEIWSVIKPMLEQVEAGFLTYENYLELLPTVDELKALAANQPPLLIDEQAPFERPRAGRR